MADDSHYKSLCCELTLQSDKRGFFKTFADNVTEVAGPKWLNEFKKLGTDKERIVFCYKDKKIYDVLHSTLDNVQKLFRSKSAHLSNQKRLEAEHLYALDKYSRAFNIINQAVVRAPPPGEDMKIDDGLSLPLALWLRAKISFELKDFESSLADIQLSLKYKLPDDYKLQAYMQMAECYIELGDRDKAKVSLVVCTKLSSQKGDKSISERSNNYLNNLDVLLKEPPKPNKFVLPSVTDGPSKEYPNASSSISPVQTRNAGRCMVASSPVNPGDTLVSEPAYAFALLPTKFGTHCLHCFKWIKIAVPCQRCSGVAFCSELCSKQAEKYHKYECPYTELTMGSGMSILCYLALRMITQNPLTYFLDIKDKLDDPLWTDHPYSKVYNLERHAEKREPKDFLHRTLMALFLLRVLRHSGYFGNYINEDIDELSDSELYIGSLLLRHIQLLQYNAHEIYETVKKSDQTHTKANTIYIGIGIYPTVALFNHDCQPAVVRYFMGTSIIIRSVRPLLPGEVVPENYGPVFTMKTLAERQKSLSSRYLFKCECKACTQDWHKLSELEHSQIKFRCHEGALSSNCCATKSELKDFMKCKHCKSTNNPSEQLHKLLLSYEDDFKLGIAAIEENDLLQAQKLLVNYIQAVCKICFPPVKGVCYAQEALRTCWAAEGNLFTLPS